MEKNTLDEREFELINILGPKISSSQRDLSRHMDMSLGMTNMLIRRLVSKGFIRIRQLNKKKVEYILTPKGFAEKMRKPVKYTLKTIQSIGVINERLRDVVQPLYESGERQFYLLGESDLVFLVETIFREEPYAQCQLQRFKEVPDSANGGVFLICTEKFDSAKLKGRKQVNLIEELAKGRQMVFEKNLPLEGDEVVLEQA